MRKGDTRKRKKHLMLQGLDVALASAKAIILKSQWFQIDPYPDDYWRLTVKIELDIDERGQPL